MKIEIHPTSHDVLECRNDVAMSDHSVIWLDVNNRPGFTHRDGLFSALDRKTISGPIDYPLRRAPKGYSVTLTQE